MGYDRCDGFPFDFESNVSPFGSKSKGKLFKIERKRDCVSRHNGGTAGAPLKLLRDDSDLGALSSID